MNWLLWAFVTAYGIFAGINLRGAYEDLRVALFHSYMIQVLQHRVPGFHDYEFAMEYAFKRHTALPFLERDEVNIRVELALAEELEGENGIIGYMKRRIAKE